MTSPQPPPSPQEAEALAALLDWCATLVGRCQLADGEARFHGRSNVLQVETSAGRCYLKVHGQADGWGAEVHAYERWARAFGQAAPRLLGVRDQEPLALLISALPGQVMKDAPLDDAQQRAAWRAAGQALAPLHDLAVGECFGPCGRDGQPLGAPATATAPAPAAGAEAEVYVLAELDRWTADGLRLGCLTPAEQEVIRAARALAPAFAGERPTPCHRDYCPYNWLVTADGAWAGVIDFEFAYWDVRVADFTRYPDWEWLTRPDLIAAFFEGYGRALTPQEEQQRLLAHVQYALSAIVWGCQHDYLGFAAEGREALHHLRRLLG